MDHGNMKLNLDIRRYPRVRPRHKQGHLYELVEIRNYPLPRTTKTWTPASFLNSLTRRRVPARRLADFED